MIEIKQYIEGVEYITNQYDNWYDLVDDLCNDIDEIIVFEWPESSKDLKEYLEENGLAPDTFTIGYTGSGNLIINRNRLIKGKMLYHQLKLIQACLAEIACSYWDIEYIKIL